MILSIIVTLVVSIIGYFLLKWIGLSIRDYIADKLIIYKLFCYGALNNKYCPEYIPNSCHYEIDFLDRWRAAFHLIPGRILFYGIIIYSVVFLFFYHPFAEGFYVWDNNYEVGDTIIVYHEEEEIKLSAIVTEVREVDGYIISVNGKSEKTYSKEDEYIERGKYKTKGRYVPSKYNFFIQMNQSVWIFIKNLFT